jgi:hypothetical protein
VAGNVVKWFIRLVRLAQSQAAVREARGAAFTGKRDVEIPAETALDFQLAEPIKVTFGESR